MTSRTAAVQVNVAKSGSRSLQANLSKAGKYLFLLLGALIVMIPILWMLSTALKSYEEIGSTAGVRWIPLNVKWGNFLSIWKDYPITTYFWNSMVTTVGSTLVCVAFSALAGYGVSRFRFGGRGFLLSFLLVTQMFPAVMKLVPYYKVLTTYGLTNSIVGLELVYISLSIPFCTWMMMGFFETIPMELDEAAMIDGCGRFKTFLQIILPLTLPGLVSTFIYAFITGWNEYMFASILITGDASKTLTVGIGQMASFYSIMWNDLMAASIISSIPLVIMFIFLQKYFIASLTAGAVKS